LFEILPLFFADGEWIFAVTNYFANDSIDGCALEGGASTNAKSQKLLNTLTELLTEHL
jgi:hypothetical protein